MSKLDNLSPAYHWHSKLLSMAGNGYISVLNAARADLRQDEWELLKDEAEGDVGGELEAIRAAKYKAE